MVAAIGLLGSSTNVFLLLRQHDAGIAVAGPLAATNDVELPSLAPPPPEETDGVADLVYDSAGRIEGLPVPAGSVEIPGVGLVRGLSTQSTMGTVRYDVRVGGVLVGRIYDDGLLLVSEGMDVSGRGGGAADSAVELADLRLATFTSYLASLAVTAQVVRRQEKPIVLDGTAGLDQTGDGGRQADGTTVAEGA